MPHHINNQLLKGSIVQLIFWKLTHRFGVYSNTVEVTLACTDSGFKDHEHGEITVTVEAENIKTMTLAEIELLAIARATEIIAK